MDILLLHPLLTLRLCWLTPFLAPAPPLDLSAYNIFNNKSLGGRLLCLQASILWLIVVSHLPALLLTRPSCCAPVSRQPFRAGNKLRHLIASAHLVIKTGFMLGQRRERFKRKRSKCKRERKGEQEGVEKEDARAVWVPTESFFFPFFAQLQPPTLSVVALGIQIKILFKCAIKYIIHKYLCVSRYILHYI